MLRWRMCIHLREYTCTTSCPTARVPYYHFGLLVLGNNHVCRCQPECDKTLRKRRLQLARRILTRHANIDSQIPVPSAEGWLHARRLCRWPITGFIGSSITGCVAGGQISSTMFLGGHGGLWQRVCRSFAVVPYDIEHHPDVHWIESILKATIWMCRRTREHPVRYIWGRCSLPYFRNIRIS